MTVFLSKIWSESGRKNQEMLNEMFYIVLKWMSYQQTFLFSSFIERNVNIALQHCALSKVRDSMLPKELIRANNDFSSFSETYQVPHSFHILLLAFFVPFITRKKAVHEKTMQQCLLFISSYVPSVKDSNFLSYSGRVTWKRRAGIYTAHFMNYALVKYGNPIFCLSKGVT